MKISIITVSFNAEKTIHSTLESVVSQTYSNIEHIVVDGASRDNTMTIVAKFRDHLTHVISEPDKGIYDAMNKGLTLASGDIICFLNADDIYAQTTTLSTIVQLMSANNLDALISDIEFFRADAPHKALRRYKSKYFRPDRLAFGWMPAHPGLFLHRRVYEQYGLFRTDLRIAGDFDFIARIFSKNTLNYDYYPQVTVRMLIGGISTGGLRNTIVLNKEVLQVCRDNDIRTNLLMILSKYPRKLLELLIK